MICGIIDLGSNTIRLSIYTTDSGSIKPLFNKKVTAGLSGYVSDGALSVKGMGKACAALHGFRSILTNFGIQTVYVFATASLRNISNTAQAVEYIKQNTRLDVDVLSGDEEARLVFAGATQSVQLEEGLVLDIGGGSSEYISFAAGSEIRASGSLPVGSLNQFYRHVSGLLPTASAMRKIRSEVLGEMKEKEFFQLGRHRDICGVGGTIRTVRKLYNEVFELPQDNAELETDKVERLLKLFEEDQKAIYRPVLQLSPERIHTIIPGMLILSTICKTCQAEHITVSGYGVREGYLLGRVLRQ